VIIREVTLPLRLVSLTNQREHWAKKAKRAKEHRWLALAAINRGHELLERGRFMVTFTRVAPRKLDDDNLRECCKHLRDGVADWFGVDDGSPMYEWRYEQEKGKPKEYAVRIRIERKEVAA